ncbi:MAG TPA: STAS domain-containing protein [Candidatus Acidoferrales bacterium]|nr:STAS domain-containing protein [Candidatus Acidoferrales bacterium]
MALLETCREAGDVAVVHLSGKITLGDGGPTLRRVVRELLDSGHRKIIFNLSEVDYIDSYGIGEMVAAHTKVCAAHGELKLIYLTRRLRDILQITRLVTVFDVQPDEAAALRSFAKST